MQAVQKVEGERDDDDEDEDAGAWRHGVGSGVLDQDVAHRVGEILALVAGVFEPLVDLFPFEDLQGVLAVPLEQVGDQAGRVRVRVLGEDRQR